MTKMINLTPHAINFLDKNNNLAACIPSSGIARATQKRVPIGTINGITVNKTEYGAVEGHPEPEYGTIYIVSVLTAQAAPYRSDLYIVDDTVRNDQGQIIGCRALAQI